MGSDRMTSQWPKPIDGGEESLFVPVMGVTGSGKSTFISLLADENVAISDSLNSCTAICKMYRVRHPSSDRLFLLDTPGFNDTNRSDIEILKEIASSLVHWHQKGWKLAGVIYLHRIIDPRIGGAALKNLHMFQALCGIENYHRIVLVTNMWNEFGPSEVEQQVGERREAELQKQPQFWRPMIDHGSLCMRHKGSKESALEILDLVCELGGAVVLQIVRQLVLHNLRLDETDSGKYIQAELQIAKERSEREHSSLIKSLDEARGEGDEEAVKDIQSDIHEATMKLEQLDRRRKDLEISAQELSGDKVKYGGPGLSMGDSEKPDISAKIIMDDQKQIQQLQFGLREANERAIEIQKQQLEKTEKQLHELQEMQRSREEKERREKKDQREEKERREKDKGRREKEYEHNGRKSSGWFKSPF
ncbi:hypothetical protein BO85DRAFT_520536 [Aspergillus piperis CBS 112811]|uniref:G domain-containing protein n=1 Tax=Aspergillus piperis CBS 112811 TaxID=1448313 RepID=A0A8G1QZ44_9EURO|nr:hypothetical protein BO85DRAFT_520536 [Aspergillus piperis CBS 112811]RAH57071.1 hypothetical protein BO85DRAFT_520536 [Aspergillus piperis CBS 112811]